MKYKDAELDSLLQWQMRFVNKDYLDVVKEHKQMYEALKDITKLVNLLIKRDELYTFAIEKAEIYKAESLLKEIEDERG